MISIKTKLKLNSLYGLHVYDGGLGGKIQANYLLGAGGAGTEELLHPAAPSGLPDLGGLPVRVASRYEAHTDIRIETINQLMNRFQLYGSEHFTFQDEVFVSKMLNKAGVSNVGDFMERLGEMVREDGGLKEQALKLAGYKGAGNGKSPEPEMSAALSYGSFQDRVYEHMKLAELTRAVYELNAGRQTERGVLSQSELLLAEQLRRADRVLTHTERQAPAQEMPEASAFGKPAPGKKAEEKPAWGLSALLLELFRNTRYMRSENVFREVVLTDDVFRECMMSFLETGRATAVKPSRRLAGQEPTVMPAQVIEVYGEILQNAEKEEGPENRDGQTDASDGDGTKQEFQSPEQLKEYLDSVNARNVHMKRLLDEAAAEAETGPRKADKQAVHKAALLALEHPDKALEVTMEREKPEGPAGQSGRFGKLMELTEPELKPFYEAALEFNSSADNERGGDTGQEYKTGRPVLREAAQTEFIRELKEVEFKARVNGAEPGLTVRDIQRLRLPGVQTQETPAGEETVHYDSPMSAGRRPPSAGLVHNRRRQEMYDQLMDEMQDVRQKIKVSEEKKASVKRSVTDKTVSRPAEYEAGAAGVQNGRAIERMVQQSLNQQVNHMSEQIYRKLEKKLKDEQRRRGF